MVRKMTKHIYSYINFNSKGGFDIKSVQKNDIQFISIRCVEGAFGDDVIEPAENALVKTYRQVDEHYTYARTNDDALEDNGTYNDNGDGGDYEMGDTMFFSPKTTL